MGHQKNPSFRTDFKNVKMTLVKSAHKKSFSQKSIEICLSLKNWVFWAKLFLGALFTTFFYKQVLGFHRPSKLYARHLGVKINGPYCISGRGRGG
jgi:hypothetical protein